MKQHASRFRFLHSFSYPQIPLLLALVFGQSWPVVAEMRTNIEYAVAGGQSLRLDAQVPEGRGPFPTVILVHGGGWTGGSKEVYITPLFKPLTDAGFTWFSINYRLAPTNHYPAAVDDVLAAVKWVKAHADEYKADPKRIVLVGESAGGHLVALVGARDGRQLGLAGVVPYYPPCDLSVLVSPDDLTNGAPKHICLFLGITRMNNDARRLLREASPVNYVSREMPPFLLIHGNADPLVPYSQSLLMRDRMKAAGATVELCTVEGAGHGMNGWERNPQMQAHKAVLVAWIRKVTGAPGR